MDIEHIRDRTDFLKVREEWNRFLFSSDMNNIFFTHEWFSSWWRHLSHDSQLEVLIFRDGEGEILGIAPLRLKDGKILFTASDEVSDYCDFITHGQSRKEFFRCLMSCFRKKYPEITCFEFINIKESSPSLQHIPELAADYGFMCIQKESDVVPALDLPLSYEEYISSLDRKRRHELRRKARRIGELEGLFRQRIRRPVSLKATVDDFIELHEASGPEKFGFWQTEGMKDFFREILYRFGLCKWADLQLVRLENSLLAALIRFFYGNEVLFYNVAYSVDFSRFSPGLYLFHESILEAIEARKKRVDFLRGGEKYKYDFGAKESRIYNLALRTGESTK